MRHTRAITIVFWVLITISLSGCFSSNPKDIEAFSMPQRVQVTAEDYILQPPDEVEVRCSEVPFIDQQVQIIRPDGKISFEAVGEIVAAGKTPGQVASNLRAKILELYKLTGDYPIDVRVVAFQSKFYYVLGQVYVPGPKIYTGRNTVLSAISEAQPNPMAWVERVQVIRPSHDKKVKPKIFEVNFDRLMAHGDARKNVLLEEGDIIFVPPTILAAIALKIEEFARPIGRAFSTVNIIYGQPTYRTTRY